MFLREKCDLGHFKGKFVEIVTGPSYIYIWTICKIIDFGLPYISLSDLRWAGNPMIPTTKIETFFFTRGFSTVLVLKTLRKRHKSKDHNFLHKSYIPHFFQLRKFLIFFDMRKKFRKFFLTRNCFRVIEIGHDQVRQVLDGF